MSERNGHITWRHLVMLGVTCLGTLVGLLIYMLDARAGYVTEKEFDRYRSSMDKRLERMENKLDRLLER